MSQKQNPSSGKRSRKHGRWLRKPSYKRYLAERRWLKNKARRIARIVRRHGWNQKSFPNLNVEVRRLVESILQKKLE
jgi:hypothetical protein